MAESRSSSKAHACAFRYPWLPTAIDRRVIVVTASRRLARELRNTYAERQIVAGKQAWKTPPIHFWQDWLVSLVGDAADPASVPGRLDPLSVSMLWERSLGRYLSDDVLAAGGVVRQAIQAWQRLREWDISLSDLSAAAGNSDERVFARVAAAVERLLDEGNWTDASRLPVVVCRLLEEDPMLAPASIVLAGFDRRTPAVRRIVAALEGAGSEISFQSAPDLNRACSLATFDEPAAELRAAGAWARSRLEADPNARIGIVSTALENNAESAARLVREGLAPGWHYGDRSHRAAVNVSYGRKLLDYPAVSVALLLLRWTCEGLRGKEVSILLRSSCVGSGDMSGRARLELHLRNHPDREWSAEGLVAALSNVDKGEDSSRFLDVIRKVAALAASEDKPAAPSSRVAEFDRLLRDAGWPGERALDSAGFQLVNRWRELLNEFARSEAVMPRVGRAEAARRLTALAAECIWQPEGEPGVVHLLGALEAAGLEFDAIWVAGVDAEQWPPPSRPSQFISHRLQREHGMPDATPADTLAFARRVLSRLIQSANECVLSWARQRDDTELTSSSLLEHVVYDTYSGPGDPGWSVNRYVGGADLERIAGDSGPPVLDGEKISGGAYTVQLQVTEPFRAFVQGRLGVAVPDLFRSGLPPGIRGNIVHNALHNLLQECPSREELNRWNDAERSRRIGSAIDAALGPYVRQADTVLTRIIGYERNRLRQLMAEFLDMEGERPDFTVSAVEEAVDYEAFGARLGLRVDRIDRLPDGRLLVIDYKTGAPKAFAGRNGELKEVQLVVYADALDADVGGLVYVNVDTRSISYKGAGGGWDTRQEETWPSTLAAWKTEVREAIKSLAAGDIRINILQSPSDGRALAILSRLEEQRRVG